MEMYLQLGHGMMQMARDLVEDWGGGSVILSPRDLDPKQMQKLAGDINELPNGKVLVDPQFYLPYSDHKRLVSHHYWPDDYDSGSFWGGRALPDLLACVFDLNADLGTSAVILPGLFADRIDDDWTDRQGALIAEARRMRPDARLFATLALGADVLRSEDQVHEVLEAFDAWEIDGAYMVWEHPKGDYLVNDSSWIANSVDLAAGVKLKRRTAIVGYCNQQALIASLASVDAIASGTWMNVRSFPPEKFRETYDDEIRSPTEWCYAPRTLSEYKVSSLDAAQRLGLLDHLRVPVELGCRYVDALFDGAQPSAVGLDRPTSFKHYLQCLHAQAATSRRATFAETVAAYSTELDGAESRLEELHERRIRGQNRDFKEIIDAQRQSISIVEAVRGPMLERAWPALT